MRVGTAAKAGDPGPDYGRRRESRSLPSVPSCAAGSFSTTTRAPSGCEDAATDMDHVEAFARYSRLGIQELNTDAPLPRRVAELDFELVIVHYSVFGTGAYTLDRGPPALAEDLTRPQGRLLNQDEDRYCGHRFWFCDEVGFDTVDTVLEPSEYAKVYGAHTRVPNIRTSVPGYVSEQIVENGERLRTARRRAADRRRLQGPPGSGRLGARRPGEVDIGRRFAELAADSGLALDIGSARTTCTAGDWPRFLSDARPCSGSSRGRRSST